MQKNLISIIIPVYNIQNELSRCVDSIINQSYSNIEIILVDDGSTDNSKQVIEKCSKLDDRIIPIYKANGGVTSARLEGVRRSSGDWIGFVDGDDYIEPDMYEHLLSNALKYDAQISHCGYQMVFPSRIDYHYNTGRLAQQDKLTGLKDLLEGSFIEPGLWNKLFHKTLFHSLLHDETMDLTIKENEDLLMNYYLFKEASNSIYEDFCPYHYILRKGSANTSKMNKNKLYYPIRVQKIIQNDIQGEKQLSSIIYGRLANMYISGASMRNPDKEQYIDEYIKFCRNEMKNMRFEFLNSGRSKSERFKYILCLFSPSLYRMFHFIYAKLKGTHNKYEVR